MVLCRMIEMQGRKKKGHTQKKRPSKQKEKEKKNKKRASLDWTEKIILTTKNPKMGKEGRKKKKKDLSAARTNRWWAMKDGRYV